MYTISNGCERFTHATRWADEQDKIQCKLINMWWFQLESIVYADRYMEILLVAMYPLQLKKFEHSPLHCSEMWLSPNATCAPFYKEMPSMCFSSNFQDGLNLGILSNKLNSQKSKPKVEHFYIFSSSDNQNETRAYPLPTSTNVIITLKLKVKIRHSFFFIRRMHPFLLSNIIEGKLHNTVRTQDMIQMQVHDTKHIKQKDREYRFVMDKETK